MLKSTFTGLQRCRWQYGSIFIRLAVVGWQICKISHNSEKIWTYSRSRSSQIINLGVNWKRICDFLLVILVTLDLSPTIFEILTLKARKWLVFPTLHLYDAPARRACSGWNLPRKTRGMWPRYGEICIILTSNCFFDWSTHVRNRRTDGRIAYNVAC